MSNLAKYKDRLGQSFPHLYIETESGEFWAVIRVKQKVRKKNLKTTRYAEAVSRLPIALADLGNEASEKKAKIERADKLLSDFWTDLRVEKVSEEASDATLTRFDSIWRNNLEPYFKDWKPSDVSADMMPSFINWHRKRKPGAQLVNVYKYLGNLLTFMMRVGAIQITQIPKMKLPKSEKLHHDKKKGRIITDGERAKLLANGSPRIRLLMGIADALGNRKMEIGSMEKSRITKEDGRSYFILDTDDTKTGMARVLPIPLHLEPALEAQLLESGGSEYLFPTKSGLRHVPSQMIDKEWAEVKRASRITGRLRFHDWRHTRATKFAKANVNPVIACTILGMTIGQYQKTYLQLKGRDLVSTVDEMSKMEAT